MVKGKIIFLCMCNCVFSLFFLFHVNFVTCITRAVSAEWFNYCSGPGFKSQVLMCVEFLVCNVHGFIGLT